MSVGLILQRSFELAGVRRPKGLGRWMQRNFEALDEGFKQQPAGPDWGAFAIALAEAGITAPDGSTFKPDTVRRAWARTVTAIAKRRAKKVEPPAKPAPQVRPVSQQARPEPAMPAAPSPTSDDPDADPSLVFKVMRKPKKAEE